MSMRRHTLGGEGALTLDQGSDGGLVGDYQEHGFAIARSIVPTAYVEQLLQQLPSVVSERRANGLPSGLNIWLDSPTALAIISLPSILAIVARLIGGGSVRLWHDQAFLREPGAPGTPPHQDSPHWCHPFASAVTAWFPLSAPAICGGAMVYLRGSHQVGRLEPCGDVRHGGGWPLLNEPVLRGCDAVTVDCKVGDVLFHHPLIVHYTTSAKSNTPRASYSAIYVAEEELKARTGLHSSERIADIYPRVIVGRQRVRNSMSEYPGEAL
jgi:phytanoyl-CoA dioxygenase PhyH